jgi:OOP family OmpA-OmpF porin
MSFKSLLTLILGLCALTALAFFCVYQHGPSIEVDLVARSASALKAADMSWSKPTANGQVITLNGAAPSQALRQKAGDVTLGISGVNAVKNKLIVAKPATSDPFVAATNTPNEHKEPTPSPYEFKLDFNGKLAILSGYAPNETIRTEIIEALRKKLGSDKVIDRLKVAAGAPESFTHTITQGLIPNVQGFTQVIATIQDSNLNITGTVPSNKMRDKLQQSLKNSIPGRIASVYNIEVQQARSSSQTKAEPQPEALTDQKNITADLCQKRFDALMVDEQITFTSDQAIIEQSSFALLDEISSIAKQCPNTKIEVAGHTDSSGDNLYNQLLSRQRADAVVSYLVATDINIERLIAKGYGETRPIASNTRKEGQAINRRIEFIILEQ